jgi:hypothetical protein
VETLPFGDAIAREEDRLRGERERMLADEGYDSFAHNHFSYLARGRYVDQLRAWLAHVPSDQLLILKSEEFFRDPPATVRRTTDFLGLPPAALIERRVHNEAAYPALPAATRRRLRACFAEKNAELEALLEEELGWR